MQNEGRMNEEWWRMMMDEWRMMKDEGWWFQAVEGFCRQTDRRTDNICDCRVVFATENYLARDGYGWLGMGWL